MICDTCGEDKSRVYFYLDNSNDTGRSATCMSCVNKQKKLEKRKVRKAIMADARRIPGSKDLVLYKRGPHSKSAQRIYTADTTPTFMQFNHIIYKHINDKYGLSYTEVNLLLFIAPIAPFPRRDFISCREIIGYKKVGLMKKFIDEDLIYIWRESNKNDKISTLYDLTQKGKYLIADIYSWALGDKEIPEVSENKAADIMAKFYQRRRSTSP